MYIIKNIFLEVDTIPYFLYGEGAGERSFRRPNSLVLGFTEDQTSSQAFFKITGNEK